MSIDTKKEMYYKFIFPKKKNVQTQAIKNLLSDRDNEGNRHTFAYDELNSSSDLKKYVDEYIKLPKYYDLRIYYDDVTGWQRQAGGASLIVSTSPLVQSCDPHGWTKFTVGTKTVYCSIVFSDSPPANSGSGFFYNYYLPKEVIEKSKLRDQIVQEKFHENWYFSLEEQNAYKQKVVSKYIKRDINGNLLDAQDNIITDITNAYVVNSPTYVPMYGEEKLSFSPNYFANEFPYSHYGGYKYYIYYIDGNGKTYTTWGQDKSTNTIIYKDSNGTEWYGDIRPPYNGIGDYFFYEAATRKEIPVIRHRFETATRKPDNTYYVTVGNKEQIVKGQRIPEQFLDISEDCKRDFIDLEASRRILYPSHYSSGRKLKLSKNNDDTINYDNVIPKVTSGVGKNTILSYDIPNEYINNPPLPINYKLLRDALNDKDPYSEQESLLIMWVVNKDPMDSSVQDLTDLQELTWEQYAIPVSLRCYIKNDNNKDELSTNRFLISYPTLIEKNFTPSNVIQPGNIVSSIQSAYSSSTDYRSGLCRFHFRRNDAYNKKFNDVLYLQGLMELSRDYLVTYHHANYTGRQLFNPQNSSNHNYPIPYHNLLDIQNYVIDKIINAAENEFNKNDYNYNTLVKQFIDYNYLKALYIRKQCTGFTYTQQQQDFYIHVNNDAYKINNKWFYSNNLHDYTSNQPSIDAINQTYIHSSITNSNNNAYFLPTAYATKNGDIVSFGGKTFTNWNFYWDTSQNGWQIYDKTYFMVFNIPEHGLITRKQITKSIKIKKGKELKRRLWYYLRNVFIVPDTEVGFVYNPPNYTDSEFENTNFKDPALETVWNDIYLSSFGFTPDINPSQTDSLLTGLNSSFIPLGFLDDHIEVDDILYGRNTNNKNIIVGFSNMFDYKSNDSYHFRYNPISDDYELVQENIIFAYMHTDIVTSNNNAPTDVYNPCKEIVNSPKLPSNCGVYIMKYEINN